MTFTEWVDLVGFPKAHKVLGFPESTLRMWYGFNRFPRPCHVVDILDKTGGVLDLERWTREYTRRQQSTNEAGQC